MLKGIKVLEFEGLAPSVFCGLYFADQGAEVIVVTKRDPAPFTMPIQANLMNRGKKCISLSPKIAKEKQIIEELIKISDIIIDPYRPGVLEKLGIGPDVIYKLNKKAILLRVTGYGQEGPMAKKPGHDLNYIGTSGIMPLINKHNKAKIYQFPVAFAADYASCSLGITATLAALAISKKTGIGRIVDCSMTDGVRYYAHIIKQTDPEFKNLPKQASFIKQGQSQYCVVVKQQNTFDPVPVVKQMHQSNQQFYENKYFSISKVKQLSPFETQITGLTNPFSIQPISKNIQIPNRNEHQKQIKQYLGSLLKERPKL